MEYEINLENLIHMKRVFEVRWWARGTPDRLECDLPITRAVSRRRRPSALALLHAPQPVRSPSLFALSCCRRRTRTAAGSWTPTNFMRSWGRTWGSRCRRQRWVLQPVLAAGPATRRHAVA